MALSPDQIKLNNQFHNHDGNLTWSLLWLGISRWNDLIWMNKKRVARALIGPVASSLMFVVLGAHLAVSYACSDSAWFQRGGAAGAMVVALGFGFRQFYSDEGVGILGGGKLPELSCRNADVVLTIWLFITTFVWGYGDLLVSGITAKT